MKPHNFLSASTTFIMESRRAVITTLISCLPHEGGESA